MSDAPCTFGRTGQTVAPVWFDRGDGRIDIGPIETVSNQTDGWLALRIGPRELDRRGDQIAADRVKAIGRVPELVIASGITGQDVKSGWPMHGLQRLRDAKLCRYFAIETPDPLEAEWIAGHTPVHAVVVPYSAHDMAARYRLFEVAATNGVAIVSHATNADEWSLQRATPQLCATILLAGHQVDRMAKLPAAAVEILWQHYQAAHPEPPKLRGAHPPETGV